MTLYQAFSVLALWIFRNKSLWGAVLCSSGRAASLVSAHRTGEPHLPLSDDNKSFQMLSAVPWWAKLPPPENNRFIDITSFLGWVSESSRAELWNFLADLSAMLSCFQSLARGSPELVCFCRKRLRGGRAELKPGHTCRELCPFQSWSSLHSVLGSSGIQLSNLHQSDAV